MNRLITITVLAAAVGATSVAAQPTGERPREGRQGHRGQAIVEFLGLTAEQQAQWTALHEQHRQAMKPFHEEGRALRQRVEESLEANEPEVMVGEAVKAMHAHREAAKQAREAFQAQLQSVLTEDQKVRFEAFQAARGSDRKGRRGRAGRGGPRGGSGGPGAGPGEPTIEG